MIGRILAALERIAASLEEYNTFTRERHDWSVLMSQQAEATLAAERERLKAARGQ